MTGAPDPAGLEARLRAREAEIGVVGLGYVGLPLALALIEAGFTVQGFDLDDTKTASLAEGRSYLAHIDDAAIGRAVASGRLAASDRVADLARAEAVLICVPTPLTRQREPDLGYVTGTVDALLPHLRRGALLVLESTTYPGTMRDVVRPRVLAAGRRPGVDLFLAYSPARGDPGNPEHGTRSIPKVVGGDGPVALALARALYDQVVPKTVPVSSMEVAEAVKLTENIFRAVNIALVNELKTVYAAMGIDVFEVIDAAKTKPFGYMAFYPGPGLGGHCIPIDPFYLTWKAREYEVPTRFIELAGEINTAMPGRVVERLALALDQRFEKGLNGSRILLVGVAYKKNVDDVRESPGLRLIELLEARGALVLFHDPHVAEIPPTREHAALAGRRSLPLDPATVAAMDAVLIVTDHDAIDYRALLDHARLVVDTRGVTRHLGRRDNVVMA
jgi:UDP-N-acetyl-D-glucosamine dehydrogenase